MPKINVKIKKDENVSYSILIENELLKKIPSLLKKIKFGERYAIITDKNVAKLYGKKLLSLLKKNSIEAILLNFPAGEKNKSFETALKIIDELLKKKWGRKDAIIALGGGVSGDLAGFVASIYKRGIAYIHIPTTLLAIVDSSIGGKTGVNLDAGKNLAGTFYQPKAVLIDPTVLKTLPQKEFINGFGEIIKSSIIADKKLFELLEKISKKKQIFDQKTLNTFITQTVKIKASIIQKDEKESGIRAWLNYGHTIGHAIEKISNYQIHHGSAVILGILCINEISKKLDLINEKDTDRINNLINDFATSDIKKQWKKIALSPQKIWEIIQNDKKMTKNGIQFIIPRKIGKVEIYKGISKEIFFKYFPKKLENLVPSQPPARPRGILKKKSY